MNKIDVASNTALLAVAEKLTEQNEILRGMGAGGAGGAGGKVYLHCITFHMDDDEGGMYWSNEFCKFYSSSNEPITSISEIPINRAHFPTIFSEAALGGETWIVEFGWINSSGKAVLNGRDFDGGGKQYIHTDSTYYYWKDTVMEV